MKTLSQVEPRTPISSLPYTISESGSYYLVANLTGVTGLNGISVQADNVTLDMNGFALVGQAASLQGVVVNPGQQNFSIFNGTIRSWGGNGLNVGAANSRVERLRVSNNGGVGLRAGDNSMVSDCAISANGGDGIQVSSFCIVQNNSCYTNGTAGIHATGTGNRIEANNLTANAGYGILVDGAGNLVIRNNAALNTTNDYSIAPGSSYGQLVGTPGAGFTNATPWANFSSSCPTGQSFCSGGVCVDLATSPNNCGSCGNACSFPNATGGCSGGACVVAACNVGYADCNGKKADGCETSLTADVNNCGGCGVVCPASANGSAACEDGNCIVAACNPGYGDCNGNPADGCETSLNADIYNCGSCGHSCSVPNSTPACTGGNCAIAACNAGFADCNAVAADGCEVNLYTSVNNCGACGKGCFVANGTAACSGGTCAIAACNAGFADCDGNPIDGCETSLTTVVNCGTCGHACFVSNGTPACSGGACVVASCNTGYRDCNNYAGDGCEINVNTDNNNCGNCGTVCNSSQQCASGSCKLKTGQTCSAGAQCASGTCTSLKCT